MVKVGITGGIGSGKSTVCRIFSVLGIPIYNADLRARDLMNSSIEIRNELQKHFGTGIYINNQLNRTQLAQIIFNDNNALNFVNSIVHPAVSKDYLNWINQQNKFSYCIKEAALLFESGSYSELDLVITVVCPEKIRISRVIKRDKISEVQVMERIKNQWDESRKVELSDFVIINDDKHSLLHQINYLHKNIQ